MGLREGDRFFYENKGVFTRRQQQEIKKASLAKVMCQNMKGSVSIQRDVFKVFDPKNDRRVTCNSISGIDLSAWQESPPPNPSETCNIGKFERMWHL